MRAVVIFPHQLFAGHPALARQGKGGPVYLAEHPRFFSDFAFHSHKLVLHRASLAAYGAELEAQGYDVRMVPHGPEFDLRAALAADGVTEVLAADPVDDALESSLRELCAARGMGLTLLDTPAFACPPSEFGSFFSHEKTYRQTSFYIHERKRLEVLLDHGQPEGGKWTYDAENRKSLPKGTAVPQPPTVNHTEHIRAAIESVANEFPDAPGDPQAFNWPVSRTQAERWRELFQAERLTRFGDYQDAMAREHPMLFHSLLSSSINIGLLNPLDVARAVEHGGGALNEREGFVRQVWGWREYVRALYVLEGETLRSGNFFGCENSMPKAFYDGTTGLAPVDHVIGKVLDTGYAHHIERLMVLGNAMLLCEIHPDAVYRWFMELFIDAYDWVMVPNVYGMSQFADGGAMMTKPYISSSNYIRKMSDYEPGPWCATWDGLFWRFLDKHREYFLTNPRTKLMAGHLERMDAATLKGHHQAAETFLETLW